MWTKTSVGSYLLEMTINGYVPWEIQPKIIPKDNFFLKFFPYLVIISISLLSGISSLIASKFNSKLKKFNKYILIGIIGFASFASFFVYSTSVQISEINERQRTVSNINLIVDYGNGTVKINENFELTDYNTTAFDALIKWSKVEYKDYGEMGILVDSINGVKGNWRYSVNGDFPGVSSNKYNLKDGDIIEWIYG